MSLFAPSEHREALFALLAFNVEVSKTREVVSEAMLGAIRLQWWREAVETLYTDAPARQHAVIQALEPAVILHKLDKQDFDRLIDGRMTDLEESPHQTMDSLIDYADATSSSVVRLSLQILTEELSDAAHEVSRNVGIAWALVGLARALPGLLQRGRVVLPEDLIAEFNIDRRSILNLEPSEELNAGVGKLSRLAMEYLEEARRLRSEVSRAGVAALLPASLADTYLRRLERAGFNVFDEKVRSPVGLATARLAYRATIGRY